RPVAAEVPALDEQVGGGDHPAVRRRDQRRVVTRAEDRALHRLQALGDARDQPELADVGNGDDLAPYPRPRTASVAAAPSRCRSHTPALRSTRPHIPTSLGRAAERADGPSGRLPETTTGRRYGWAVMAGDGQ